MLYIGASPVPVAMNTLGLAESWRTNPPNIPRIDTLSPTVTSFRSLAPRPRSVSLIRNVSCRHVCSAIEYDRVKSHSVSDHMNVANCPGTLVSSVVISITSLSVTGLRYIFSIIFASIHFGASVVSSTGTKSALVTPQSGQRQSSGISENSVPAFIPSSSSQRTGS